MQVGAVNQTVDVGTDASPVETVNPTLGQSITGRTLTNISPNGPDIHTKLYRRPHEFDLPEQAPKA